jgi:hypothetical protein
MHALPCRQGGANSQFLILNSQLKCPALQAGYTRTFVRPQVIDLRGMHRIAPCLNRSEAELANTFKNKKR